MSYDVSSIQRTLARFPSAKISITPTPIYNLSRLSSHVGHNIYVMREDLTGFAIGGNKIRKLDYLIGDAMACGADTLITLKANNFTRNAAAAGKAFGFDVHVILAGRESEQNSASQKLFKQFGASLYYVPGNDPDALMAEYDRVAGELKNQGRVIYEMPPGGSTRIGALGYINAFDQIVQYSQTSGIHFNRVIHATGSTGTQAGLLLGQHLSAYDTTIIGMATNLKADAQTERIRELAVETAEMLEVPFDQSRIIVDDGFIGPGYEIESEEGKEAVELFAKLEGILLDDVYSGKAAAGLLHYARNEVLEKNENTLFIHTGGNAGQYY